MRIPSETLPLKLYGSDTKAFTEGKKAAPVDSSAKLRAALSSSLAKPQHALEEENTEQGQVHDRNHGQPGAEERRQDDRRKAKQAVLLDTRLTRSRRESARLSAIDIKI